MAWIARILHILSVLLRHAAAHCAGGLLRRIGLSRFAPGETVPKPERLKLIMEDLGGSFIKLGQMLALQPDILPLEYCNALYDLLDRVTPVPPDEIEQVFLAEIGRRPQEVFDSFEREAIASGSIGQVHIAYLDGKKYAVKVQRPDADSDFTRDIKVMSVSVWFIKRLRIRWLSWMIDPMTEFSSWTKEELDFRYEASYMLRLRKHSSDSTTEYVPPVESRFTTRRTLAVEFLNGIAILDHFRKREEGDAAHDRTLEELGFDADQFSRNVIDNFLGDAFLHGIFHADLHPANLMILKDNVVGYIDFGITGVISQYSRQNLVAMTLAYANTDIDMLCQRFFNVSTLTPESDPAAFREGLKRLSESWYDTSGSAVPTTVTLVMLDMLRLARDACILPQRDVIRYIRSAIAIDGLIRRFAPEFDVGQYLATACRRFLSAHARHTLFAPSSLVDWLQSNVDLAYDGAFRATGLLDRFGTERNTSDHRSAADSTPDRSAALNLAIVAVVVALLIGLNREPMEFGANLITAQITVMCATTTLLSRAIWMSS